MISTSVLFTSAHLPGDPSFDLGASCGLAEWRQDVPLLFKLLVGAGAQAVPWPAYDAGEEADCVLAAPMAQAQATWRQVSALMEPPRDAAASTARDAIGALLAGGQRWLVLDCVQLIEHDIGTADFDSALRRLRDDGAALHAALLRGDRASLAPLLRAEAPAIGHWASTGSAHLYAIEEVDTAELPFLQGLSVRDWIEDVLCYTVAGGRPYAAGLVTPYGRWIVPLALGAVELTTVHAEDGWLIFAVKAADGDKDGDNAWHGVMDLNGTIVLPASPAAVYIIGANLLQQVAPSGASRVLRLPDGALLHDKVDNIGQRNDGYLDFERQLNDSTERNVLGVMDASGNVVLPAHYSSVQDFGAGKRLAIVSQYVDGHYLFGLANTAGQLLAPCRYRLIDSATTSSPPRVRKRLIYAIDGQGLACMLTLDGQPAFTPRYPPAHRLPGVAVQDGFLYVANDTMVWTMDFSGTLLEQIATLEQFQADISAQLGAALGLNAASSASDTDDNSYTTAQLLAQVDRDRLRAIAALLLLGDATLAARCVDLTLQYLADEDAEGEYNGATLEAACLFPLWSIASDVLGHGTTLDWKSVDQVDIIGQHIRIAALRDFRWPADDDDNDDAGAGIEEGLAAVARHLAPHGLHLVNMLAGEDTYYLAVLRTQDIAALQRVAEEAGLPTLIY